jgi:hypothetical protein
VGSVAKRPWFWGGHDVISLEYRELREKDYEALAPLLGCSTRKQFQTCVDSKLITVATNMGTAVGATGLPILRQTVATLKGRGIEARLERWARESRRNAS